MFLVCSACPKVPLLLTYRRHTSAALKYSGPHIFEDTHSACPKAKWFEVKCSDLYSILSNVPYPHPLTYTLPSMCLFASVSFIFYFFLLFFLLLLFACAHPSISFQPALKQALLLCFRRAETRRERPEEHQAGSLSPDQPDSKGHAERTRRKRGAQKNKHRARQKKSQFIRPLCPPFALYPFAHTPFPLSSLQHAPLLSGQPREVSPSPTLSPSSLPQSPLSQSPACSPSRDPKVSGSQRLQTRSHPPNLLPLSHSRKSMHETLPNTVTLRWCE